MVNSSRCSREVLETSTGEKVEGRILRDLMTGNSYCLSLCKCLRCSPRDS